MMDKSKNQSMVVKVSTKAIDGLVSALMIGVLVVIIRQLYHLFTTDLFSAEIKSAVDNGLFILILLELFVVLLFYLRNHHIKVERVVEVGIISVVRELIFHALDMEVLRLFALSGVLLVLGLLFFIEKHFRDRESLS
jgi:uncharacterized membrane protein (DUF373 family)